MGALYQGEAYLEGKEVQTVKEEVGKEKARARCRGGAEIWEARYPVLDK